MKGLLEEGLLVLRLLLLSVGFEVVVEGYVFGKFLVDLIKRSFISGNQHWVVITILNDIVSFYLLFIKNSFQVKQTNLPNCVLHLCTLAVLEIVIKLQEFVLQMFEV